MNQGQPKFSSDFWVDAADWIHGVWWAELAHHEGGPSCQWFGYVRKIPFDAWFWESAVRQERTMRWIKRSGFETSAASAQQAIFDHQEGVRLAGYYSRTAAGWIVEGGPSRVRELLENPFPFHPWPTWLSLTIQERKP